MSLWVLDTDHLSEFQRGNVQIAQRIAKTKPQDLAVTVVTIQEQLQGWLNVINKANQPSNANRLVSAYTRLQAALNDFKGLNALPFDQPACNYYTKLKNQIRIGTQDLRIAAIVLSVNGILVTRNQRDFAQVPGLNFEDWTI